MMSKKPLEEHHLIRLLKDFDSALVLSYLSKVKSVIKLLEEEGFLGMVELIKNDKLIDPIGFRISLREPVFLLLTHPICRIRSKVPYPKMLGWERFFVTHLGMVPLYLANLNVITVLKLWGEDSSHIISKPFKDELEKGGLLLELSPSSRPAQYSSMNFILQYGATGYKACEELFDPLQKYYKYSFWAFPGRGYTFSSHFLHTRAKITSFMKVTKSLYTVNSVGNYKCIYIEGHPIECKEMDLIGFTFRGTELHFTRRIKAYAPVDTVEDLEKKKDIHECFLNATMTEVRSEFGRLNLLSDIIDIGESTFDLTSTIVGLLVNFIYSHSDRPCYVCDTPEFRKHLTFLLRTLLKHIKLPITISDIVDIFDIVLRSLYPLLVVDENRLMFTHPMAIGFVAQQNKLNLLNFDNYQVLVDLLNLLEKTHATKRTMDIYLDPRMDMFRGENKKESLSTLYSIERRIRLYKRFYRIFSGLE